MVQHPGGGDHDVDDISVAGCGLEVPATVDEVAAGDLVAEADALVDAVLAGDALEVGADLTPGREAVAPVGRQRERVGVEV